MMTTAQVAPKPAAREARSAVRGYAHVAEARLSCRASRDCPTDAERQHRHDDYLQEWRHSRQSAGTKGMEAYSQR